MARLYDQYVAAVRSGDEETARAFAEWLAAFWDDGPAEPPTPPAALSLLGGIGRGIRWHETGTMVLGYVRGWTRRGCYQVPAAVLGSVDPPLAAAA